MKMLQRIHPRVFLKIAIFPALIMLVLGLMPMPVQAQAPDPAPLIFELALDSGGFLFYGGFIQDRDGFFWIVTGVGLAKWDGYTLKKYVAGSDAHSISAGAIFTIHEDRDGAIWLTTADGLNKYDKQTDSFTVYKNKPDDPHSLSASEFNPANQTLAEDSEGCLWVGTVNGLNSYDPKTGTFTRYLHDPAVPGSLGDNSIWAVYVDKQDDVWVGTKSGLDKFDRQTQVFTHYTHDPQKPNSLSSNWVPAMLEDSKGVLWIGTQDGGLNRFNSQSGDFTSYRNDPANPRSLSSDGVWSITEVKPGELWLTHSSFTSTGLDIFDTQAETFRNYQNDPKVAGSLSSNTLVNVYRDRQAAVWVVNWTGQLDRLDPEGRKFKVYRHDPNNDNSPAGNLVGGVIKDKTGIVWIVFAENNIVDRYDPRSGIFTHYQNPEAIAHAGMIEGDEHTLWLVGINPTGTGLLCQFDKTAGKCIKSYSFDGLGSQSILEDKTQPGILWIPNWEGGLVKFDKVTEKATYFKHDANNPASISGNTIWQIFQDNDGFLWIPYTSVGLDKFDPRTGKVVKHYGSDPNNAASLSTNIVNAVFADSSGQFWVGTAFGLDKLNKDDVTFTHYNTTTGLPANSIVNFLEDNQGFLWLGSKSGMIRFDPKTETSRLYTKDDGLASTEYWEAPNYKAADGEMWFYAGNGISSFYPDQIKDNPYKPPIYFTALTQGGEPLKNVKQAPERVKAITLDWQSNFFEFEVAALNFTKSERNQYQYMLEGFDKEWYNAGTKRNGRYSGLPDGTYTLRVRGSNNDGVWSDQEATLKVNVVGPFWRTTWFMLLMVLAVVGSAAGGMLWRRQMREAQRRAAEERQRDLERQVAERTALLETANKELEAFAYSVSHDLRAPLRHIDGFIEMLQHSTKATLDGQSQHYMDVIADSARQMGTLIDDLLLFSRMGRTEMSKAQVDLGELVQNVIRELGPETEGRNIQWKISSLPLITGDRAMLRIVMTNLISNALKYTRPRSQAEIEIGWMPGHETETIVFIRDNGVGFDMQYADKLFGVFQRLHHQEDFEGTGIGLANIRRIISRHGGRTWAEGQVDHGATFYFSLPCIKIGDIS
jgi:signal transduction histidine kinase/streptogramin lyase